MSYRSPWSFVSEALGGIGGLGMQYGAELQQRNAVQGQQIKGEVGGQVAQMEAALADPNYSWKPAEKQAAQAFVTQGRTLLGMDDAAVPGSYEEWSKRGISVPKTVIGQGSAGKPMAAKETLTPYQGGVSGFIGNVNAGVAQAGQEQEQFLEEAGQLRQLQLLGKQNEYNIGIAQMENRWGKQRLEDEQLFTTETNQAALDVHGSATAREGIIQSLTAIGDVTAPKNKQAVERIMKRARSIGLEPWDLETVQATAIGLGSATAAMDFTAKTETLMQGKLTTEQMQQQVGLNEQALKIGDQTFQLGQLQISNEEWLASRRGTEAALADTAAVQNLLGTAYAQGDTGFIQERIDLLESGDESNPQYQALVSAGVTPEELEGKLVRLQGDEAFRLREQGMQDALIEEEYSNIFFRAETNKAGLLDTLAKRYTPKELEQKMADDADPLGRMVDTGMLGDADMRALSRQALLYRDLENEELLAPKVERAWKKLDALAAVPADPTVAENALRSTLGTMVEAGTMTENEAAGLVTTYKNAWDHGQRVQDNDLATSIATRAYNEVQATALRAEVEALNSESDPITNGLSEEQARYYTTTRGLYTDVISSIMDDAELNGCGFSPDGLGIDPSGGETCENYALEVRRARDKLLELGDTLTLGTVDTSRRVVDLAERIGAGQATPQEEQEFTTYEQALGEDGIASILGVAPPGQQPAEPTPEGTTEQEAAPAEPKQGGVGGLFNNLWNLGPGGATTRLNETLAAPPATSGGQGTQTARGSATPTTLTTTGPGTTANLRADKEFTTLVNGLSEFGDMSAPQQQALAAGIAARSGLTPGTVLQMAQQELTSTMENPVPAPRPSYSAPWRGR